MRRAARRIVDMPREGMAPPPRHPARAALVVPVHGREVGDHGGHTAQVAGRPGPPWSMTTGSRRVVSPSAIQHNCASSVIDKWPCVSIEVTAENLPVSPRLRQG